MGPGCAFIDYDNDGWPDILLVNGEDWPGHPEARDSTPKLYHNNHDGTFTDVTRKAGLAVPCSDWVSPSAITTMTATTICSSPRWAEPSVPQQRQWHVHAM